MRILITWFVLAVLLVSASNAQSRQFMFVFLNTNPNRQELPKEQADSLQALHMANIGRLAKEGKLLAAGPFYGGGGIFVLNTGSVEQANEWLSTDPAVRAKRWNLEVMPYTPRIGSICSVGETYTMTTYHFVRYTPRTDASPEKVRDAWAAHERHIKTFSPADSVVAEGMLGERQSSMVVFKGDANEEFIKSDPSVRDGVLEATIKKIYIAKGSFCER